MQNSEVKPNVIEHAARCSSVISSDILSRNTLSLSFLNYVLLFSSCFQFVNSRYEFLAYTVNLNYQNTLLNTVEEISMVVIGPFFNIVVFCLLIIFCWAMQRLFGTFPNIFSRFIMAYGINVLLDPIWVLIVDSALMRCVDGCLNSHYLLG